MGVQLHRWIECLLNGLRLAIETPLQKQIWAYHKTHIHGHLVPWRTEMAIRSASDIRLVGVVDALFLEIPMDGCRTDTLVLHLKDWKYSHDVTACLTEYTLQLNMYKYILESHYTGISFCVGALAYTHIHIASMELVVFHETLQTYEIVHVPDIQPVIVQQMQMRKKDIN
jgi:hypothetical protein